jgi:hypothetical protein
VLVKIWQAFLDTLDEQGLLDWDEVFVDASFSPAKKGGTESAMKFAQGSRSLQCRCKYAPAPSSW